VLTVSKFLYSFLRPDPRAASAVESFFHRGDEAVPATVFRPAKARGRLPGWLLLHGLTYTGREHPQLVRLARAVAATGCVVYVPDIPEWRALRVAPAVAVPTIQAAVRTLHDRDDVDPDRTGLLGFSFGATQGLVAAADPDVGGLLRGVVAWGGYYDLQSVVRFGLSGEFVHDGRTLHLQPDPYGCWIMAGNYLTHVDGYQDHGDVAAALRELASESGRRRTYAWDPIYDPLKVRLRAELPAARRRTFDLLAPLTTKRVTTSPEGMALADVLAIAAARVDPLLVPAPHLARLQVPTLLAHGRDDRLIPFTESLALANAVPPSALRNVTVTGLFAHSGGTQRGMGRMGRLREGTRFVAMLNRLLALLD
jgi:acetyl esterase/lipase